MLLNLSLLSREATFPVTIYRRYMPPGNADQNRGSTQILLTAGHSYSIDPTSQVQNMTLNPLKMTNVVGRWLM